MLDEVTYARDLDVQVLELFVCVWLAFFCRGADMTTLLYCLVSWFCCGCCCWACGLVVVVFACGSFFGDCAEEGQMEDFAPSPFLSPSRARVWSCTVVNKSCTRLNHRWRIASGCRSFYRDCTRGSFGSDVLTLHCMHLGSSSEHLKAMWPRHWQL